MQQFHQFTSKLRRRLSEELAWPWQSLQKAFIDSGVRLSWLNYRWV